MKSGVLAPALLIAHVRYWSRALGWPAALALALAIAAAMTAWSSMEMEDRAAVLRTGIAEAQARLAARAAPEEAETRRLAQLPDGETLSAVVSALHAGARKNEVQLDQGEYRLQQEAGTRLNRFRITFPVHGSYPHIHTWLADAITDQPGLMLEGIDFKRENIGEEKLEAKVRLVLLVRDR